jgi:putative FmdB family regulatory protein
MPIYEYHCEDCHKQMSLFIRSISNPPPLGCRFCHSQQLTRLISRVVTPKSEESRLDSLGDPSGLDEQDPKSMARWMKNMAGEMGEDLGDDMMDEMESASEAPADNGDDAPL